MQSPPETHDTEAFSAGLLNPQQGSPAELTAVNGKGTVKRYNVYRNNVTVSLINSLADIFPAVAKIIGETAFRELARSYVRAHPPSSPMLFLYGQNFAEFIDGFEQLKNLPYLPDVARTERCWLSAFHAADAAPLDPAELSRIAPEHLGLCTFIPHPAMHALRSDYAIFDVFAMNRGHSELRPVDLSIGQSVLITRAALEVDVTLIDDGAHKFIEKLANGEPLASAAAKATECDPSFDLGAVLTLALSKGVFTKVTPVGQQ